MIVSRADRAADLRRPPVAHRGGRHRASTAGRRGTSGTTSPRWRCATRRRCCGTAPTSRPPTSTSPSSTTASASSRWPGSRRSGFCGKGEGGPFIEGGARIALDGELPAQHPRRPALGRAPARLRLPARGVRAALGRGRRPPGAPATPEVAVAAAGGGPLGGVPAAHARSMTPPMPAWSIRRSLVRGRGWRRSSSRAR